MCMINNKIIDSFVYSNGSYNSNNLRDTDINYIFLALNFYKTIDDEVLSLKEDLATINTNLLNKLDRKDDFFIFTELSELEFKVIKIALNIYAFIKNISESELI